MVVLFKQRYPVADAGQLLGTRHARRSRSDHSNVFIRVRFRDARFNPAFAPPCIDDGAFNGLNGDRMVFQIQSARRFARGRANASGEFRKIIGRV